MTEKKGRGARRSDPPATEATGDLKAQRAEFVQTFFKKGAEFTEELVRENERLRHQKAALERENAQLRTQLASDTAIRDLLSKIKELEHEKDELLSSMHDAEATTGRFAHRFREIENELENFANLYVASYQLHSTLRLSLVVRHLKELLMQLVGVRALAFYVLDADKHELFALTSEGIDESAVPRVALHDGANGDGGSAAALIERAFLTGVAHVDEGSLDASRESRSSLPVACVPMRLDDQVIGVIAIFSVLEQKSRFIAVDFELFKLLGAHAGTALVAAQLYANAGAKPPPLRPLGKSTT